MLFSLVKVAPQCEGGPQVDVGGQIFRGDFQGPGKMRLRFRDAFPAEQDGPQVVMGTGVIRVESQGLTETA